MSDYNDDDDDGINFQICLDIDSPERPFYFSFEDKETAVEFWFTIEETKAMVNALSHILDEIKTGAINDARH